MSAKTRKSEPRLFDLTPLESFNCQQIVMYLEDFFVEFISQNLVVKTLV